MAYKPIEAVASWKDWEATQLPVRNPPRRRKKPVLVESPFETFNGLEVRLALVRAPDYDPDVLVQASNDDALVGALRKMSLEPVESMLSVILDAKLRVLGIYVAARGQVSSVVVHPADLIRPVLLAGVESFIMAHNHPSGDPKPSLDDRVLTQRVIAAAKCVHLTLLDHVVVGTRRHASLRVEAPELFT